MIRTLILFCVLQERQQFHLEQLRAAEFRARSQAQQQLNKEQGAAAPAGQTPAPAGTQPAGPAAAAAPAASQ